MTLLLTLFGSLDTEIVLLCWGCFLTSTFTLLAIMGCPMFMGSPSPQPTGCLTTVAGHCRFCINKKCFFLWRLLLKRFISFRTSRTGAPRSTGPSRKRSSKPSWMPDASSMQRTSRSVGLIRIDSLFSMRSTSGTSRARKCYFLSASFYLERHASILWTSIQTLYKVWMW